jgi:hypothetical protein
LDALQGYYQIPLDEKNQLSDKNFVAFGQILIFKSPYGYEKFE